MVPRIARPSLAPPSPENFYLVDFDGIEGLETSDFPQKLCTQMLRSQIPKPFIPRDRTNLIALFNKSISCDDAFFRSDPLKTVLAGLPLKDLLNFSATCKFSYLVVRSNRIWEIKLRQLLPSILSLKDCRLNLEQQFQVIFRKIAAERKPYRQLLELYKTYLLKFNEQLNGMKSQKPNSLTEEAQLTQLVGKSYTRSHRSIAPDSKMGRCIIACKLIPQQFDKQEAFEKVIRTAEEAYLFEEKIS